MNRKVLVAGLVVVLPLLVVPPRGAPLTGDALETRTEQVASLLRCPVCQGLSVADSPSSTAQNMKAHIRELVAQGYNQDQILAYFERSYSEFVRLEPAPARRELGGLDRPRGGAAVGRRHRALRAAVAEGRRVPFGPTGRGRGGP